jgi:hypothetical protein
MQNEEQLIVILNNCDKEQLNKYLSDDDALDLLVKSIEQYQTISNEKDNLDKTNKNLAEKNLKLEPKLESLKTNLQTSIINFEKVKLEYISLKEAYDKQLNLCNSTSFGSISNSLNLRAIKAEEETDKMAENYFNAAYSIHTEEELNNFQKLFLEERALAHVKKIKAEKMRDLKLHK